MKTADDRPSIWNLRTCLLSSVDFAEEFASNQPEHTLAVTSFVQDIRRIQKELMTSFKEGAPPSSLHDIINGLTGARAMASIMAERYPENSGLLIRFEEDLKHALEKLIRSVRPEVYRQA